MGDRERSEHLGARGATAHAKRARGHKGSAQLGAGSERRGAKPCNARERKELKVWKGQKGVGATHDMPVGMRCASEVQVKSVSSVERVVCSVRRAVRRAPAAAVRRGRRERIGLYARHGYRHEHRPPAPGRALNK